MSVDQTKEEIIRTINGAFTFKGEDVYKVSEEFFDWCEKIESKYGITLLTNRTDYNGHFPTNRTRVVDKK